MRLVQLHTGKKPEPRPLGSTQGGSIRVDVRDLERSLRKRVEGEVRFDEGSRALYALDASNFRQVPIGVVVPRTVEDVVQTVAVCREHDAPVLSRGGGTSLAGQCCNVAVVIDWSKYLGQVKELDFARRTATVLPGTVLDDLRDRAEEMHLTFGPDPATHDRCTLGGMLGNNSCGVHAQMAGQVADNVIELDVLTYDGLRLKVGKTSDDELRRLVHEGGRRGEIYRGLLELRDRHGDLVRERYPKIPRRISGYNLDALLPERGFDVARALVGTEGTCVTILEAKLRLVDSPPARALLLLGYPDVFRAADHLEDVLRYDPIALEGMDERLFQNIREKGLHERWMELMPDGGGVLLVEFGGETKEEAKARALEAAAKIRTREARPNVRVITDEKDMKHAWKVRESGLGATARVPGEPDTWPGWEDSAVPPEKVGAYLRDLQKLYDRHGWHAALYGHFGQGCIHTRIPFDLASESGVSEYRRFMDEASDLVVRYGGSLSGEHGDGQQRGELLPKMFGPELVQAFREFKAIWDPKNRMNPGKVVDPYPLDMNLRLGGHYDPWRPETQFRYPEDEGQFERATLRCVGVGKCRRESIDDGGTMCPSYLVTKEERHTTRGRAHLLHEMLQGDFLKEGWKSDAVMESLELCLSCKGCKSDCPVNVDMATYKAEFLAHHYAGRLRPRPAYSMGLIMYWARLARLAPEVVNALLHTPPLANAARWLAGATQERPIPRFAPASFQSWFRDRPTPQTPTPRGRVVLWPDTFNNHFFPEVARAATEVLEGLGYEVDVPRGFVCCGRPLYDYGMLTTAKRRLRHSMQVLEEAIEGGVPVIGLEPSCVSVFRDELEAMYPASAAARQLSRSTFLFGEFLRRENERSPLPLPQLHAKALVHGHCHHKSIIDKHLLDEPKLLDAIGLDHEVLEGSGCCGMAGSFGYEAGDKYEVSVAAGERYLLPKVRQARATTLIVADGFSCREQVMQGTDRMPIHTAQLLQLAKDAGPDAPQVDRPERGIVTRGIAGPTRRRVIGTGVFLGALAGAAAAALLARSRR